MATPPAVDSMIEQLCKAASDGDLGRVMGLCTTLVNFDFKNKTFKDKGFLHYAAASGRTNVCKYLIEDLKFDANRKDGSGCTPLHHASREGHYATVTFLVKHCANICEENNAGVTALCLATLEGRTEVMEILLHCGANAKDSTPKGTLLQVSAKRGDEDAVRNLLKFGADPNEYNPRAFSPLCAAICAKSLGSVHALLEAKANPNAVCIKSTPLHFVASDGVVEMIDELIQKEADPNALDADAYTPLEIAASLSRREHFIVLSKFTRIMDCYSNMSYDTIKSELSSPRACEQRILKSKQKVEVQFRKAMEFFRETENFTETLSKLSLVISECPWHLDALLKRAILYSTGEKPDYVKALQDIDRCFKIDFESTKTEMDVFIVGARASFQTRKYQDAIIACNMGLQLDPYHQKLQQIRVDAEAALKVAASTAMDTGY